MLSIIDQLSPWLKPWEWSFQFLIFWIVINCGPGWYVIYKNRKSGWIESRDRAYEPFARIDYNDWSYALCLLSHFYFWPRYIVGWSVFFIGCLGAAFFCTGADPYNLPRWRLECIRLNCYVTGFIALFLNNVVYRNKRIDYDYSKYLGKDWKKSYDGAGIYIQNHTNSQDVMITWLTQWPQPGALGKKDSLKVPLVKYLVGPFNYLLVGRDKNEDSAEERKNLLETIK